jgi:hypothetical protein
LKRYLENKISETEVRKEIDEQLGHFKTKLVEEIFNGNIEIPTTSAQKNGQPAEIEAAAELV